MFLLLIELILSLLVLLGLHAWIKKKLFSVWKDGVWDAARRREQEISLRSVP